MKAHRLRLNSMGVREVSCLVFFVSLAARGAYLAQLMHSPLSALGSMDTEIYVQQAGRILQGNWLGDEAFFQSGFLYSYFLAACQFVFGPGKLPVLLIQIVADSCAALLLTILARRFFGLGAGLVAGLAYALYGPFIAGSCQLLLDLPILFPLLAGLVLYYRAGDKRRPAHMVAAGLLIGVAVVSRPYLLPLAVLPLVTALRQDGARSFLQRVRLPLLASIGIVLVLGSVALRNRVVGDEWVLTSGGGGLGLLSGQQSGCDRGLLHPGGIGH